MVQGEIPGREESLRSQRVSLHSIVPCSYLSLWNHKFLNKGLPQGKKKTPSFCNRPQNNSSCLPVIKSITLATGGEAVIFSHLLSFSWVSTYSLQELRKPQGRESWVDGCHPGSRCALSCSYLESRAEGMWDYVVGRKGFGQDPKG